MAQVARRGRDQERGVPVDLEPLGGEALGRRQKLGERHPAEAFVGQAKRGEAARHGKGHGPLEVAVVQDLGPAEEIAGDLAGERVGAWIQGRGRHHAAVDGVGPVRIGAVDEHRRTTAEATHPGLGRGQCHGGRDRRVDGIAARRQDLCADLGGLAVLCCHDATPAMDGVLG
jgi:hypothetical protein